MHADDVIFLGEWSWLNAQHLICLLRYCFLISGLKVNVHKSNVLGIGVSDDDVASMANVIGCGATNLPMKYLGVRVGCNMSRCSNWNVIITKFCSTLSSWKARLLSIGGRLSLIKLILGSLPSYYMSLYLMPTTVRNKLESMRNKFFIGGDQEDKKVTWVKWKKCMASREREGLGIGLWARVIQNLYGIDGGINKIHGCYSKRSTWGAIVHFISRLKVQGMDLLSLCSRNIGDEESTRRVTLANWSLVLRRDPRGGIETSQFNALKAAIGLKLNRLPSRVNLDRKGIDIGSILCLICHEDIETVNHIFFNCGMAQDLWALLAKWWELNIPLCANISEWYDRLDDSPIPSKARFILEGVGGALLWTILNYRNCLLFSSSHSKKSDLWDSIVSQSFLWISSRNPKFRCSWVYWLQNPLATISSL
ncbi:RNA-directed DNA polymerase, eukaryota, reverse transcriptase zinc-binding domain protein [Tanacetum coccineum]|uniref:RNA-directed DNA polymerase, eukaryota, reverse transcriptase zinc-binding domain protein n=1 Tax=Tanacetum coccineum TaxID=301880 RepID=A0ABQ5D7E8_9ASTR